MCLKMICSDIFYSLSDMAIFDRFLPGFIYCLTSYSHFIMQMGVYV